MEYSVLLECLKKKEIAPVYFFYGDEKYLLDQATNSVIEASVVPEVKDFNFDVFYGSDVDVGKVLDIASSFPMMAQRRTVVIKEVQNLSAAHIRNLAKYAESPVPSTCLILVASTGQVKGEAYNALKKSSVSIEFKLLYENQVPAWVKQYVKNKGKDITLPAIQLLQAHVGNSLLNIANELEKIFLNLNGRNHIEETDVQFVVGFSREYTIFHLINAVGERRLKDSIQIVNQLLEYGESAPGIIVRLMNYFSTLLKFIEYLKKGKSDRELAQVAGVNFYFVKDYKMQSANFTAQQVESAFAALSEADLNLKTSFQTPQLVMDILV